MKTIIALVAAPVLALGVVACGGNDADAPTEANIESDTAANPMVPTTAAGTYTSTTEDGTDLSLTLNGDGSYTMMQGGQQTEAGTWEDNIRGTCLTAQGASETCYNIQPGTTAGTVSITDNEGVVREFRVQ
ncbi:hypothetical protein GRI62_05500 [Erythrobacter arachoides]|uniref:Uncharacterized protein n=1 Tax=Aurantiacibacter arachoides TaxID=1850444 RepID=A0A845A0J3_9SPHN|nr:hypothetical protein [Aurantiacibacter arachoides]MXO93060.1 hypothetical protein [Aurantiacibacter arachoides]